MGDLHKSPAKIQISTKSGTQTGFLNHFLDLGRVLKFPLQKLLRVSFLVILFVRKLMISKRRMMFLALTTLTLSLTRDVLRPSNLWRLHDILDYRQEMQTTSETQGQPIYPSAFCNWDNIEGHYDNITKYFQGETEEGRRDVEALLLARNKVTETKFTFFSPSLSNSAKRHPSFKRNLRNLTKVLNVLCEIMHRKNDEKDLEEFMSAITLLEGIQSVHFFRGKGISTLAGLVFSGLKRLYRMMTSHEKLTKLLDDALAMADWSTRVPEGRKRSPFNPQGLSSEEQEYDIQNRIEQSRLTVVDCLKDKKEFWEAYDITANFLAFRLSFETKASYPTSYLDKISIELKDFPGILFQKSRFINYKAGLSGPDKLFIEFLDRQGISRAPVVLTLANPYLKVP